MKKIVSLLLAFVLVLAGCSSGSDTFTYTVTANIESLDTVDASYSQTFTLFADVFMGAQTIDGEGNLADGGSTSVEVSEDGLVYTIKLREDVKWVDNTGAEKGNVVAQDYVTAYQRMVNPDNASVYSYIFEPIQNATAISAGEKAVEELGVKALDDYTLEITLDYVAPYFQSMLAFQSFSPVATGAVEEFGEDYGTSAETTWYNGPYYVSEYDTAYIVSLKKNDLYFNADNVQVENIDLRVTEDSTARYNAFTNGEIDYGEIGSTEDYAAGKEAGVITDQMTGYSFYVTMNQAPEATTSNENLRNALKYGFDRETILMNASGEINKPIEYVIPADMTGAAYDGVEYRDYAGDSLITYDKEKANKYFDAYMKDMGYTDRSQIEVEYLGTADGNGGNKPAEVIQAFYLQEFGITVNLTIQPFEQMVESRKAGAFDFMATGWGPDYADPSTYLALWQTSQIGAMNTVSYSNKEYDELFAKANVEQDTAKRFEMFAELEQMLVDDGVLIPFYQKNAPYVLSEEYDLPIHLFFKISHEYLTVK
ncbi:peptide ABC transporter substrate-binding protein [Mollicutes bacterium LVI A0039]|nr:peptide ABC transporter substrate-binding protein [Mollicutes bacterium LVI A0039]